MNLDRLYKILSETTVQLRKGEPVTRGTIAPGIESVTLDFNPPVAAARPDLEMVDLVLLVVGVDKVKAEEHKAELLEILATYPQPERLVGGPSYIEVGAEIGDQGAAFQLFALGKVLGIWGIVTPGVFGVSGEQALELAGSGMVMITGFDRARADA